VIAAWHEKEAAVNFPPWLRWLLVIAAIVLAVLALLVAAGAVGHIAAWLLPLAVILLGLAVAIP
jgi:putative Ca2+/H+ antiporter (TMEM165/GDT1 family)